MTIRLSTILPPSKETTANKLAFTQQFNGILRGDFCLYQHYWPNPPPKYQMGGLS